MESMWGHCCSSLCCTPWTQCIAVLRLSAVTLYFCHLQMTRQQKDWPGSAFNVSGGVWRTAGQCRDGSLAEVVPACGCYPALIKFTAVGGNTLPLTRCIGETERSCVLKNRGVRSVCQHLSQRCMMDSYPIQARSII